MLHKIVCSEMVSSIACNSSSYCELYIPMLSISPGTLAHYSVNASQRIRGKKRENPYRIKKDRKKEIENRIRKRLTNAVTALVDSSKKKRAFNSATGKWFSFKNNFITLTLSKKQVHPDRVIHEKIFKEFIRAWKQEEPNLLYVYKAEVQDNGNLHYHLVTNSFIHHRDLRSMWNYYQYGFGYTDGDNPNSTDVHALQNVDDPAAYLAKYMAKDDEFCKSIPINKEGCEVNKNGVYFKRKRKIELKKWDCSLVLKKFRIEPLDMSELVINQAGELKKECRFLAKKYKTVVKYKYAWLQGFRKKWLVDCPVLRGIYLAALAELIEINNKTNHLNLVI